MTKLTEEQIEKQAFEKFDQEWRKEFWEDRAIDVEIRAKLSEQGILTSGVKSAIDARDNLNLARASKIGLFGSSQSVKGTEPKPDIKHRGPGGPGSRGSS